MGQARAMGRTHGEAQCAWPLSVLPVPACPSRSVSVPLAPSKHAKAKANVCKKQKPTTLKQVNQKADIPSLLSFEQSHTVARLCKRWAELFLEQRPQWQGNSHVDTGIKNFRISWRGSACQHPHQLTECGPAPPGLPSAHLLRSLQSHP